MRATTGQKSRPQDKLVIFDDDPYYGALLAATAPGFDFMPSYFSSIYDLKPFSQLKDFDFAIIDIYMGSIRGDELAEYIDMFCADVPVILISGQDLHIPACESHWPTSVRSFLPKSVGPYKILEAARSTLRRERLLRRLAAAPSGVSDPSMNLEPDRPADTA